VKAPVNENTTMFQKPKDGTHLARVYRLIDVGTHERNFQGDVKQVRQILVSYELPLEKLTAGDHAGEPFTVHERLTFSMSRKSNLCGRVEAIRGKSFSSDQEALDFSLDTVVGMGCLLATETSDCGRYTNIVSITAPPEGTKVPDPINPPVVLSLEPDEFDRATFGILSDGLKQTIADSPEFKALDDSEEIPF